MTYLDDHEFQEVHRRIKKSDVSELRRRLDAGLDPNATSKFGWSLLMLAALEGRRDLLDLLISRGADPRPKNNVGFTAEILALSKDHRKAADFLAQHMAKANETEANPESSVSAEPETGLLLVRPAGRVC